MANRTLTALFDTKAAAEDAKARLVKTGVSSGSIDIHDQGSMGSASGSSSQAREGGLMSSLKGMFGAHDDTHAYAEGLNRGHFLLTAKVDDDKTDAAIQVLEGSGAIDFDQKQTEWKGAGWAAPTTGTAIGTRGTEDAIQIAEERLVVGKREVARGGVRVRSYIVETPVSEQVSLREETVNVERRPVNRPLTAADDAFKDRTIEMHETAEEAVVGKEAIVKEELLLKKDVGQRTEEIRDSVRHTEVDVERTGGVESTSDRTSLNPAPKRV